MEEESSFDGSLDSSNANSIYWANIGSPPFSPLGNISTPLAAIRTNKSNVNDSIYQILEHIPAEEKLNQSLEEESVLAEESPVIFSPSRNLWLKTCSKLTSCLEDRGYRINQLLIEDIDPVTQ
jgi:hypothetical protein